MRENLYSDYLFELSEIISRLEFVRHHSLSDYLEKAIQALEEEADLEARKIEKEQEIERSDEEDYLSRNR